LVHVSDIARAFLAVLAAPRNAVHNLAFNVGSPGNNVTVAEIANSVLEAVPGADLKITGEAGGDQRSYRVDFSLMERLVPAYRPAWTISRGAGELVSSYRKYGFDRESFTTRFTRLARIKQRLEAGAIGPDLRPILNRAATSGQGGGG
jgi:nucleoside-diphosphate-sugar epimerase